MSATAPVPYLSSYGTMIGRGEIETHVLQTLSDWIVPYIAAYERKYGLPPRSTPVPPTPESIHGGLDHLTWEAALTPELIAVVQPSGEVERFPDAGYGQWYQIQVSATVYVEGDEDRSRKLADIYGTSLQLLLTQQGAFGVAVEGTEPFATRTRLVHGAAAAFVDADVRDVVREIVTVQTFITGLADDLEGPRTPPENPYATPLPWPLANEIEVELTAETIDGTPGPQTNTVTIDGTVVPTKITYE